MMIVTLTMTIIFLLCPFLLVSLLTPMKDISWKRPMMKSFFQEETNNNHLDGKHNIGLNADGPTVVGTPSSLHQQCLQPHQGLHIQLHMMIWFKTKLSSSLLT